MLSARARSPRAGGDAGRTSTRRQSRCGPSSPIFSGRRQAEVDGHRHQDGNRRAVDQRGLVPPLLDRGDRRRVELRHGTQHLDVAHLACRADGCFQDYDALNAGRPGHGGIDRRDIVDLCGAEGPPLPIRIGSFERSAGRSGSSSTVCSSSSTACNCSWRAAARSTSSTRRSLDGSCSTALPVDSGKRPTRTPTRCAVGDSPLYGRAPALLHAALPLPARTAAETAARSPASVAPQRHRGARPRRLSAAAGAVPGFFGKLTRVVGEVAAALPATPALRQMVGLVAHVFATPIPVVWEMELAELYRWTDEAGSLVRRVHGSPARRR